ncbi:glycosyltransferase family 4 protein [Jeongeupia wiesaeckerbachi]|uniref:glycosyltransferase family 4 protein n=1 Tax=Jeongeupia wiesaeckerbachi TaxID=3051218 RepID=UPI003D801A2D
MRILHTESSCGWGGQEIRILTEAAGMLARGHQVTILACPNSNIYPAARERGIPAVALPIEKKRIGSLRAMRGWLAQHKHEFDVINTHSSTDAWLVAVAGATLSGMPPTVRTRHVSTDINKSATTRWLYLTATRHIVTTGERLRKTLNRDNGFPLNRMTSIPTGVDLERFTPPLSRSAARARLGLADKPTLGILATLRNWKGHGYLFDAWPALTERFPDWQLVIVGDGPQRQNLERRVAEAGWTNVVFAGNRDDVPDWLASMDLFTLPSYGNEGVPQGIMQAMACGLPVVSTPVGAIAEAVLDGQTGTLVPPQDAKALTEALAALMGDAAQRQRYASNGLAHARATFGLERMLDRMEAVFGAAMAK